MVKPIIQILSHQIDCSARLQYHVPLNTLLHSFSSLADLLVWWRHLKLLTIQQAQAHPRHPELHVRIPHRSTSTCTCKETYYPSSMLYNNTPAASCHRDARDGDLHASAGMVIPFHPGTSQTWHVHVAVLLSRRHVTLAVAIRAKVKGPDRCEWSRLESWEAACRATPL